MPIWKLHPVARAGDPRWQDHHYKKPLFVQAETTAEARIKAATWERKDITERLGNESPADKSAFLDEKLYEAVEMADGNAAVENGRTDIIR